MRVAIPAATVAGSTESFFEISYAERGEPDNASKFGRGRQESRGMRRLGDRIHFPRTPPLTPLRDPPAARSPYCLPSSGEGKRPEHRF